MIQEEKLRKILTSSQTDEQKLLAIEKEINLREKQLADMLHNILCTLPHAEQGTVITPDMCKYWIEETMEDSWTRPFHLLWMKKANTILNVMDCELALEGVEKLTGIIAEIEKEEDLTFEFIFLFYMKERYGLIPESSQTNPMP